MIRTNPIQAFFRIFAATTIHGIYNFMAAVPGLPSIIAILVAFSALFTAISTIHTGWASEGKPLDKNGENQ
jgi:flagellar biosynthesis component FlhA